MDKTPKALGIAAIVLGALTSLTSLVGLLTQSLMKSALSAFGQWADRLPHQPGQPSMGDMMEQTTSVLDATRPYQYAQSGGMLVLSLVLVAIGIAVVQRQPWSRKAAMGWAVAALCFLPVMIWIQAFVIQPMAQEAVAQAMPTAQRDLPIQGFMRAFQAAASVVGTLTFYAPFPILLLVLLRREKSKAWFQPDRIAPDGSGGAAP